MNTIIISKKIADGLYLTQAGALALATPPAMKEYITNNVRNVAGRKYLATSAQMDDTQISVQFLVMPEGSNKTLGAVMAAFAGMIAANGDFAIDGETYKYKSASTPTESNGVFYFNANLIKLAPKNGD